VATPGCALKFDGENDKITIKQDKSAVDELTYEAWVFAEDLKGWRVIRNDVGWNNADTHW